jgi:hypothetical protein
LIVGFLDDQGLLNVKWQWLTVLIAIVAGPFKMLKNFFSGGTSGTDSILKRNETTKIEEAAHREEFDLMITEKKAEIELLQKDIDLLDTKVQLLEEKKKNINKEVDEMNSDEVQDELIKRFG